MAQAYNGKVRAWTKEMKPTHEPRSITKRSPVAINPAFECALDDSLCEENLQPIQMDTPGKVAVTPAAKTESRTPTKCNWDVKPKSSKRQKVSPALPWTVLALIGTTCLISLLALLLTLLMFFGEMEATNCRCGGQQGKAPNTSGLDANVDLPDEVTSLQSKVKQLEGELDVHKGIITGQENNIKILQQEVQQGRERTETQEKKLNESSGERFQQMTRLVGFQVALNSTRQDVEELKQVWEAVNATKEDVEKNVWGAVNKTEGKLVQLSRVWFVVNSTKEKVQQLKEASQNLTTEMEIISKMPGPRGPPGYNGSQGINGSQGPAGPTGQKGAGDFSQCQYKLKEGTPVNSGAHAQQDVLIIEPSDKRIIGATCSTDDAHEYRLSSEIVPPGSIKAGRRMYKCKCAGRSDKMKNSAGKMTCILHYWECPMP